MGKINLKCINILILITSVSCLVLIHFAAFVNLLSFSPRAPLCSSADTLKIKSLQISVKGISITLWLRSIHRYFWNISQSSRCWCPPENKSRSCTSGKSTIYRSQRSRSKSLGMNMATHHYAVNVELEEKLICISGYVCNCKYMLVYVLFHRFTQCCITMTQWEHPLGVRLSEAHMESCQFIG